MTTAAPERKTWWRRPREDDPEADVPELRPGQSSIGDPQIAHGRLWYVDDQNELQADLHEGQSRTWQSRRRYVAMIAGSQSGKALALDTPIPTPSGFRLMGELEPGDVVFDELGQPTRVSYCSPVYHNRACFRVTFDDGTSVVADAEHNWLTRSSSERKADRRPRTLNAPYQATRPQCRRSVPSTSVKTTVQMAAKVTDSRGASNHSIELAQPVDLPDAVLPVPPYTLGVWLGDGHSTAAAITTADPEILDGIRAEGVPVGDSYDANAGKALGYRLTTSTRGGSVAMRDASVQGRLRLLGVLGRGRKHIPDRYLFASQAQRLAVLQGVMDTDGSIGPSGTCDLTLANWRLADDVATLARSLGIKVRRAVHSYSGAARLTFTTNVPVFRLARKVARLPKRPTRPDTRRRYIVRVDPVESVPVRCITVDARSHLYLCTRSYVPTHNTSFGPLWLWREIQERGPGDYMVVTPTHPLAKLKALPEFLRLFRDTLHAGEYVRSDKVFRFHDGETNVFFGMATNPESLESATAKAVWLDECGQVQFHLESWEAIERRLALNMGRALLTTTPYNLGWLLHRIVKPWQDGDPDIDVINFPSVANPAFPKEADERQRRVLPDWKYQMFYRGKIVAPAGMIYGDSFIDDWWLPDGGGHVVKPFYIPPSWPRYVGVDFGGANTAIIWIAHDIERDVFIVYREAHRGGLSASQHVERFRQESYGENIQRVWGGAKGESQQRLEWQQAGLWVEGPPDELIAQGGVEESIVEAGIGRIIELWRTRRLLVFSNLMGLRSELGAYARKLDPLGNPTNEILDKKKWHRLDALRYVGQNLSGPLLFRPIFGLTHAGRIGSGGSRRRAA